MDRLTIALDIEMMQWNDLIDTLDNLIWWITAQPNHGNIDYDDISSGQIDT